MRTFHCEHCQHAIYFENTQCTHCGHVLGVVPERLRVSALRPQPDGTWTPLAQPRQRYRQCENYRVHQVCNWLVTDTSGERFCIACRLNRTIPNLDRPGYRERWQRLERGKHRLVYSLVKLGLPLRGKQEDPAGLAFSFMSNADAAPGQAIRTGHADGHITIDIDEADPALRERSRVDMQEKYRTLLGHFRHEIGHYYWDRLVRDSDRLQAFRALFGDERRDYAEALDSYYRDGAPPDWQDAFISRYASAHPWEDWAESWAHYLHIVDTLETAHFYGVRIERYRPDGRPQRADPRFDPYLAGDFAAILAHWQPLTEALNSLNRSMGLPDLYPFVLSAPATEKLHFVHDTVCQHRSFDRGYLPSAETEPALGPRWPWLRRLLQPR
jgi:hypothetical protein